MYDRDFESKLQQQAANNYNTAKMESPDICGASVQGSIGQTPSRYRSAPLEEMENQQASIAKDFDLRNQGINFLRENPAFNEFIRLIRMGAISI